MAAESRLSDPRGEALRAFLETAGWWDGTITPLAGDASNRRYFRVVKGSDHAVLMDAPPDRGEDVRPFVRMTEHLRGAGLSAPALLAQDPDAGFLLLEDLGDDLFARLLERSPTDETDLYAAAVDLLADALPPAGPEIAAAYDWEVLLREARAAPDWYLAGVTGQSPSADLLAEFADLLASALTPVRDDRSCLVLRDYHAENLLWLPERIGAARVGLLDYQDALCGHPAYDLVSLLEDARRDTAPTLQESMVSRYLAKRADIEPRAFRAAYAALGAQRNLKIVGYFARLSMRDSKDRYLDLIPRVWQHLTRDLAHGDLAALRRFVERHLPSPEPSRLAAIRARPTGPQPTP